MSYVVMNGVNIKTENVLIEMRGCIQEGRRMVHLYVILSHLMFYGSFVPQDLQKGKTLGILLNRIGQKLIKPGYTVFLLSPSS